jgi:hypothetical protein
MTEHRLPTSAETRAILEGLTESDPIRVQVGNWSIPINGRTAKMGFLYQYLIAGRVSEVSGKYAPQRRHAIELRLDKEPAIMFVVKTAKRKTKRGWSLRPVTVPLDPKYEPLTKAVYDYMKTFKPDDYPFLLHPNPETSKRYAEAYAKQIFQTYEWNFVTYTRSAYADLELGYTYDLQTRRRSVISEEDFKRLQPRVNYEKFPGSIPISVRIESRWKDLLTHEIRKQRLRDLERPYYFDSIDLNYYAGWESKDREKAAASRHYLELDLDENPDNIRILADMSRRYFKKLLIPIENLLDSANSEIGGIEIIG